MRDSLGRKIDYLRLSVTDRCNLRCVYCMPPSGIPPVSQDDILTIEEMVEATRIVAATTGISKVRITGGEPLVRKGVSDVIRGVASLGFREVTLTTNGILLSEMAGTLAKAGLDRINVSLDSLRDDRLVSITRGNITLAQIEEGIRSAMEAGMKPVKVNCVVLRGWNDDEIADFILWSRNMKVTVRFIEHMPSMLPPDAFVSRDEILERASVLGPIVNLEENRGSTASLHRVGKDGPVFGSIAPLSGHMCTYCSRVRLSATGFLQTCLHRESGISLREMMRNGIPVDVMKAGIRRAVRNKPASGGGCFSTEMWKIGG